ncbi:MAG: hypothetical protein EA405_09535 [Rhodospirillales bacterium]|nr:MAG: hypothetical protein EA405_09535 [Rhodospirillales bacterium]
MADRPACDVLILAHVEIPEAGPAALLRVCGVPLIERAIRLATASAAARISVSCGHDDVAMHARALGAEIVPIPGDSSAGAAAAIEAYLARSGDTVSAVVVVLDVGACLLEPGDLGGIERARAETGADSAVAVVPVTGPTWRMDGNGRAGAVVVEAATAGGGSDVMDAGILYVSSREGLRLTGQCVHGRTALHPIPSERSLCVRTRADRDAAEARLLSSRRRDLSARLPERPAALVMDFDGVFTDNKVLVDETGREAVRCDRSDGLGLERLRAAGLPLMVLSKERNPVVQARCGKLKLECLQGIDDKRPALERWCRERNLDIRSVIFIGNDINDVPCLEAAGCAVAVADAYDAAIHAADIVLDRPGGAGALRELADLILDRLARVR